MTTTGDADIRHTLGYLEGRMDEQTALLQQIVTQIEQINGRFDQVNARFDQVNDRIDRVNGRIDKLYMVAFGMGSGIIAALIGVIVTLTI